MAKIDPSLFKDWNNGETINASEYKQEREIIRVAVNDNSDNKTDKTGDHQGTWKGLDTTEIGDIIQSDTPPEGADEGTLWLDTSDSSFQGTVFEPLEATVQEHTTQLEIKTGTSAPSTIPDFLGQEFIDTTNKVAYKAVGTGSSADWKQITV